LLLSTCNLSKFRFCSAPLASRRGDF